MEKRHIVVLLVLASLLIFAAGYKYAQVKSIYPAGEEILVASEGLVGDTQKLPGESDGKNAGLAEIVVHVAGEVQRPGVYRLAPGSRVVDAVDMAGTTENSALDYLNLAAPLQDGSQIRVFSKEEIAGQSSPVTMYGGSGMPAQLYSGAINGGSTRLININTAGPAELQELPGIGPALAQRIIDHRNKNGPFVSPEDLMSVSGIGEKRFEQLKDKICVN